MIRKYGLWAPKNSIKSYPKSRLFIDILVLGFNWKKIIHNIYEISHTTVIYFFHYHCLKILINSDYFMYIHQERSQNYKVNLIYAISKSLMLQWVKVARYSFSGSIPPMFEHKLNRHKQRFGKIVTTILLDEDENLLWSGLQWHRSCRSNEMTKLPLLLAAVFIGTGSCNYPLIIFCAIRINITWRWRHNSFSCKPNSCPYRHFLWKCFTLRILWVLVFCCANFTKICPRNFEIFLNLYKKSIKNVRTENWT